MVTIVVGAAKYPHFAHEPHCDYYDRDDDHELKTVPAGKRAFLPQTHHLSSFLIAKEEESKLWE